MSEKARCLRAIIIVSIFALFLAGPITCAHGEEGPWSLDISTYPWGEHDEITRTDYHLNYSIKGEHWVNASFPCEVEVKGACQDMVDAFNRAHELRMEAEEPVIRDTNTPTNDNMLPWPPNSKGVPNCTTYGANGCTEGKSNEK